jgi:hypothetical protein
MKHRNDRLLRSDPGRCGTLHAQSTPPDFSGVYYPINPFGPFRRRPAAGARQPNRDRHRVHRIGAALGWIARTFAGCAVAHARVHGEVANDQQNAHRRLVRIRSHGQVPASRNAGDDEHGLRHGGDAEQGQDHLLQRTERRLRRVYLDGRKPSQKVLDDPTYAGYSTGHWEGDTLVVDTVALRDNTFIEGFTPHSDAMTVHERIRLKEPGCWKISSPLPIRRR